MPFQVSGFNVANLIAVEEHAVEAGLGNWAEYVLQQAQRVVPIEESTLLNSGTYAVAGKEAAVGFGSGAAAAYAVPQHEGDFNHDAGRTNKYLEGPAVASGPAGEQFLAAALGQAM